MADFFEDLEKRKLSDLLDDQLKKQVDVVWPKEVLSIEKHGLLNAKKILDVGTGNGHFLMRLASRYPNKEFIGVECNKNLAEKAKSRIKDQKLKNVQILNVKCPFDEKIDCDFILARYSTYGMQDVSSFFEWTYSILPKKAGICVIDVDHGLVYSFPENKAWNDYFNSIAKRVQSMGGDRFIGRKLPHYLANVGFKNIKIEYGEWYSFYEMGFEKFVNFWKEAYFCIHKLMPGSFTEKQLEEFGEFLEGINESTTDIFDYPQVVVSAVK